MRPSQRLWAFDEEAAREDAMDPIRPIGISILSWLHIIAGTGGGAVSLLLLLSMSGNPRTQEVLAALGIPPPLLAISVALIFGTTLASGVGMWKGRPWGWYIGSFVYAYSVTRNVIALFSVHSILDSLPPDAVANSSHGPEYYYLKYGARVLVQFLIYLYFFKSNVRSFFGLSEAKKWKPVLAHVGICLVVVVLSNVVIMLAQ
jgi:hypothetical protein